MEEEQDDRCNDIASLEEVWQQIQQLTTSDRKKLLRFADIRARAFRHGAQSHDGGELYSEALKRIAAGGRRWRKSNPFFRFARDVIASISDEWRKSADRSGVVLEADFQGSSSGEAPADLRELGGRAPAARRTLQPVEFRVFAREVLELAHLHFARDKIAEAVLTALENGKTKQEVIGDGIADEKQYELAMKRLRYWYYAVSNKEDRRA